MGKSFRNPEPSRRLARGGVCEISKNKRKVSFKFNFRLNRFLVKSMLKFDARFKKRIETGCNKHTMFY